MFKPVNQPASSFSIALLLTLLLCALVLYLDYGASNSNVLICRPEAKYSEAAAAAGAAQRGFLVSGCCWSSFCPCLHPRCIGMCWMLFTACAFCQQTLDVDRMGCNYIQGLMLSVVQQVRAIAHHLILDSRVRHFVT